MLGLFESDSLIGIRLSTLDLLGDFLVFLLRSSLPVSEGIMEEFSGSEVVEMGKEVNLSLHTKIKRN